MTGVVTPSPGSAVLGHVELCGLLLEVGTLEQVSAWFLEKIGAQRVSPADIVAHINAATCYRLLRNPDMAEALQQSGNLLFDGVGMRLGAGIVGVGRQPAINGTDLFPLLMERLDRAGARIYLFGGRPGIADLAAQVIERAWPRVRVVGTQHGFLPEDEEASVCSTMAAAGPDLVLVGLGFGLQERFALDHRHHLDGTVLWMVGGLFDFVSGATPRAPAWMRRANLEWLFRLALEPRRMFWRNAVAAPLFLLECLRHRMVRGRARSR